LKSLSQRRRKGPRLRTVPSKLNSSASQRSLSLGISSTAAIILMKSLSRASPATSTSHLRVAWRGLRSHLLCQQNRKVLEALDYLDRLLARLERTVRKTASQRRA